MLAYLMFKIGKIGWLRKMLDPIRYRLIVKRKLKKMNELFSRHSKEVFTETCQILNRQGVVFWPEFGTLLGIYRENGFIKHDFDFDFGAFVEDSDCIKTLLLQNGYMLVHEYEGINHPEIKEMTFSYKGINVDLFFFNRKSDIYSCYLFAHYDMNLKGECKFKVKEIQFPAFNLQRTNFLGVGINMPDDTHRHLAVSYGSNFMIPDPNFKSIHNEYLENIYAHNKL